MAPATRPVISFIVPVRNDAQHLRRCLETIEASREGVPSEIVVADNGSTDESAVVARCAGARVLSLPYRPVADVRNQAARAASGDLLAFVDADHELDRGWSAAVLDLMRDPAVVAVGAPYFAPAEGTWVQRMYDRLRRHQPGCQVVDWLPSGNLVVRRSAFEDVGGFDTSLQTCEDVDLCQRLKARGGRLVAADALRSVHRGDPRTLKALFFGELWRGRDNLRVTLRGPTLRSMPSLAIPVLNLAALTLLPAGLLTWSLGGRAVALAAAATLAVLIALRAATLVARGGGPARSATAAGQAVLVAAVYDVARALALVTRSGHDVRRNA